MTFTPLRVGIAGAALFLLVTTTAVWFMVRSPENEQPQPASQQATEQQKSEFLALHQNYQGVYSTAHSTGDVSVFPTLYYNDPAFDIDELAPDCIPIIKRYEDRIESILTSYGVASQASTPGVLSCEIADIFYLYESSAAWEAVQTQAAAEGRPPKMSDLPDGLQPIDLPGSDEHLATVESRLVTATVQGDHATVQIASPAYGALYEHMLLTNRDGTWYISGIWSSGNP